MKTIWLLFLWVNITSCAEAPKDPNVYAREFYNDSIKFGVEAGSVHFRFVEKLRTRAGVEALGICNCQGEIRLNTDFWDAYGEWGRRALVYHEMGHCAVGIGCSGSFPHPPGGLIMAPKQTVSDYYEKNWEILVRTLFKERR